MVRVSACEVLRDSVRRTGDRDRDEGPDDPEGDAPGGDREHDRQWVEIYCLTHDKGLKDVTVEGAHNDGEEDDQQSDDRTSFG